MATEALGIYPVKISTLRDGALLLCGLLLLAHETVIVSEPREALLLVATAMLGLPASLLADRKFVRRSEDAKPPEIPPTDTTAQEETSK